MRVLSAPVGGAGQLPGHLPQRDAGLSVATAGSSPRSGRGLLLFLRAPLLGVARRAGARPRLWFRARVLDLAALRIPYPARTFIHAPNALGNFCFDVTLGYRRLEKPRRAADDWRQVR